MYFHHLKGSSRRDNYWNAHEKKMILLCQFLCHINDEECAIFALE